MEDERYVKQIRKRKQAGRRGVIKHPESDVTWESRHFKRATSWRRRKRRITEK